MCSEVNPWAAAGRARPRSHSGNHQHDGHGVAPLPDVQFDTRADRGRDYDRQMLFDWMKRRGTAVPSAVTPRVDAAKQHGDKKAGKYRLLYEYLEHRYANTVVLTFGQIEDLLGFTLPDPARTHREWWTTADIPTAEARCSDAWTLAHRTATPNLTAQTVVFERVS